MTYLRAVWPPLILWMASFLTLLILPLGWWSLPIAVTSVIFYIDLCGRTEDYENLRETAWMDGGHCKNRKFADRYGRTFCGRTVFSAVYPRVMGPLGWIDTKAYYRYYKGYRWYHILPDGTFSKDSPFLKWNFWRNLSRGH
ncbi:MAG: hypothetical protein AB7V06_25655 [Candidatus Obscuribacterales bacterium]